MNHNYSYNLLCFLRDAKIPVIIGQDFFGQREVAGIITYVSKMGKFPDQGIIIDHRSPVLMDHLISLKFEGMDTKLMKLIL
jgi:hypothetical protein